MLRTATAIALVLTTPGGPVLGQANEPPPLVVVISVDQMRADYLDRFGDRFEHGLGRLFAEGLRYDSAEHQHAFTDTAPGHATIITGTYPSSHGIVDNDWWDRVQRRTVYAVEDLDSPVLGAPGLEGRSPRNLLRPGLGDWLKEASEDSRVISVALKDRVAVLMGGHRADGAYWYNSDNGQFVTSQYYAPDVPDWLAEFNQTGLVDSLLRAGWHRLLPEDAYIASREDWFEPETSGDHPAFPHLFSMTEVAVEGEPGRKGIVPDSVAYFELRNTPLSDVPTFALARLLVERADLGRGPAPDLLLVGASGGDYVGHQYGPFSVEVEDYYFRLDRLVGEFLAFLDERLGNSYAVVLTSDHGVAVMAEEAVRRGEDAVRLDASAFQRQLLEGLQEAAVQAEIYAQPRLVYIWPLGIVINFPDDSVTLDQVKSLRQVTARALRGAESVLGVVTYDDLMAGQVDDEFAAAYLRNFHPDRAADIVLRFRPGYHYPASLPANHGSPYLYDRHVPLVFWHAGPTGGRITRRVDTVDIAPTIAVMLGIEPPESIDGHRLVEVTGSPGH